MASRALPPLFRPLVPSSARPFTSSSALSARVKRKTFNPHTAARAKKQRLANIALQARLRQERSKSQADPVLGRPTPFLKSLEAEIPPPRPLTSMFASMGKKPFAHDAKLNHYLKPAELSNFLERSLHLSTPHTTAIDEGVIRVQQEVHAQKVEAIRRIVALGNGSSSDCTRAKKQIVIDTFGRHITDGTLPQDPGAKSPDARGKTPRAGPDTGSSEVQAAILTVKIRTLHQEMEKMKSLNKDKHNKRNLRLMVHRRQKLLKYLKRKEKGGVRYRNILDALGLDDAAVQNEVFM